MRLKQRMWLNSRCQLDLCDAVGLYGPNPRSALQDQVQHRMPPAFAGDRESWIAVPIGSQHRGEWTETQMLLPTFEMLISRYACRKHRQCVGSDAQMNFH